MLELRLLDEESAGEPLALRAWDGAGAVRPLSPEQLWTGRALRA
ncbi:hypothetical protein [Streptomyces sp. NTH33]